MVATAAGAIVSQDTAKSWAGYAAAVAGAVVTAATAASTKLKPAEKLKFALRNHADFEEVAMRAENGLARGGDHELVSALTDRLTEIRRREPPD